MRSRSGSGVLSAVDHDRDGTSPGHVNADRPGWRRLQASLRGATILPLVASAAVAGCGNSAVPSTSASSSVTTSQTAAVPSSAPFVRSDTEWTTYMGDPARSGVGPSTPVAASPHRTWTAPVDGDVYAEPLVTGGSVIVATEQDSVYSLDAATGAIRWRAHLGDPVALAQLVCGNIDPNGITSTPVVDSAAGVVYAVAMLGGPLRHELFAVRLSDGGVLWHRTVDPPGTSPRVHQQRGSLNLAHGRVYFSYGGFAGDCGRYHGWVVAAPTDGASHIDAWQVPANVGGAIWAPPGPVVSTSGDVWVSTGNTLAGAGDTAGTYDGANSVMRLDPALSAPTDQWAPQNWGELNHGDIDLGSLAPALLPAGLVFVAGKEGIGYLLRDTHLGGIGGEVFKGKVCQQGGASKGAYGGAAVGAGLVLVPCKDGLTALRIDASTPSFTVAWRAAPGANSAVVAYGLVWTVAAIGPNGSQDIWNGSLTGIDPATGAVKTQLALGGIPHYAAPAAAGGSLYIAGLGKVYAVSAA